MRDRDRAILADLARFRAMSRDDIAALHFAHLRSPITSCNIVMKRLRRDGHVEVNTNRQPYVYFPMPSPIKKDGQKVDHFLEIVRFYRDLCAYGQPQVFTVEPKYGSAYMEPDVFMIWKGAPFFVEIQRHQYSTAVMAAKIKRYEAYARSGEWRKLPWQPKGQPVFPYIWIVGEARYNLQTKMLRVFQSKGVSEFLRMVGA